MTANDSWQYQGRQNYGWFGTGRKAADSQTVSTKRPRSTAFRRSFSDSNRRLQTGPSTTPSTSGSGQPRSFGPTLLIGYDYSTAPMPFSWPLVFIPGSAENEAFVRSTNRLFHELTGDTGLVHTEVDSPHIEPVGVAGKKPDEIDEIARGKGLIPKGPDPKTGRGAYIDPKTGEQRILIHPDGPTGGHIHVNDSDGNRLDITGKHVPVESPEAHLPIGR